MENKIIPYFIMSALLIFIIIILIISNYKTANNFEFYDISVPIDVYIIKYENEELSSQRDQENIIDVFENVNILWSQANIIVDIENIEVIIVKEDIYNNNFNKLLIYVAEMGHYDENNINAYFANTLHGSNGIAFPGNRIMIADRTSVYDFRATSHEIGHVLGLSHVNPTHRLMARGVNGFDLNEQEISVARNNAIKFNR